MLDQLPTELLQHIVRLAVPPMEDVRSNKNSRTALYNLCFVNKHCHAVAYPLLWRDVTVPSREQATALLSELDSRPDEPSGFDLAWLQKSYLRWINLEDVYLSTPLPSSPLSAVHSLYLGGLKAPVDTWRALLSPSTLPSLRALSIFLPLDSDTVAVWPDIPIELFQQLELLQLHSEDASRIPPTLLRTTETTVILRLAPHGFDTFSPPPSIMPLHVAANARPDWLGPDPLPDRLFDLVNRLETLHLSSTLRPERLDPSFIATDGAPPLRGIVETALSRCQALNIKVVWHDRLEGPWVSPTLWRWAKKRKAEQARKAVEAASGSRSG
ncbi:hypothetical protein JCM10207_006345 [Rhodosporidiobolus poonsookiae]